MIRKLPFVTFCLFILLSACTKHTQVPESLPRSVPEAEGVSSEEIINFLDAVAKSKQELHSFMFLRHGKVIAEGWWNPYQPDLKHTMYSTSKSFTSTAVGFAVNEKRLTVNDKVISFFPKDLPDTISPFLAALTVKDLLIMSAGQDPDPTHTMVTRDTNWVKAFLANPIKNKPGTKFLYNTLATYTLSAIVQKVTGEKVVDYLGPRLFEPLKIKGAEWEEDLLGINTGGWGLRIKTEDMAKFGQLYLQKGKWNGIQVLPASWIEEATTFKIDQAPGQPQTKKDSSDWMQGYCYQFWRCRNNAFRADGAFGQFIIVMPEKDAVVVLTSESPDMQDEINLVWEYLLPAIHDDKLPSNQETEKSLRQKLASLALPLNAKSPVSPVEKAIAGKSFTMLPNDMHYESISFKFTGDECRLNLKADSTNYLLHFGSGAWKNDETEKLGPSLLAFAKTNFNKHSVSKVAGNYSWKNDSTLELTLRYIESPHSQKMLCKFSQNKVQVEIANSLDFGSKKTKMAGEIK